MNRETHEYRFALSTGDLHVRTFREDTPFEQLLGVAARRNSRRGFLFVSKVLGRHIPVSPLRMRLKHLELSRKIPVDLPGPILFIALAETATALGMGVFSEYQAITGRTDLWCVPTTRYQLAGEVAAFSEEHSHATAHRIHASAELQRMFPHIRSLVIVDDELSTGKTAANVRSALLPLLPSLQRSMVVALVDWSPEQELLPVVSLLQGTYEFTPRQLSADTGRAEVAFPRTVPSNGRHGCSKPPTVTPKQLAGLVGIPGRKTLVLGCGEFTWLPFQVALRLESLGEDVVVQSVTRSPILTGFAVTEALSLEDPYHEGVEHFLYNFRREWYDRVLLGVEDPSTAVDCARMLDAELLALEMSSCSDTIS